MSVNFAFVLFLSFFVLCLSVCNASVCNVWTLVVTRTKVVYLRSSF